MAPAPISANSDTPEASPPGPNSQTPALAPALAQAPVPVMPPMPPTDEQNLPTVVQVPVASGSQGPPAPMKPVSAPHTKFRFTAVKKAFDNTFNIQETNNSTICDIIAMYLKGQKLLYTEAKTACEQRLNFLMLPAIFVTATCTILSLVLRETEFGATLVSGLNGFNAFLLALISYLKLDAKAEAHRTAAYKFDKLQSNLEFNSGKILFVSEKSEELEKIISDTENAVREIKETNQFILPESIRFAFPKLYNINVFAEVKKIQNKEMSVINDLKDVMNDLYNLRSELEKRPGTPGSVTKDELAELERLELLQKRLTSEIIQMRDDYLDIDDKFEEEMEIHRMHFRRRCQPCGWLKS